MKCLLNELEHPINKTKKRVEPIEKDCNMKITFLNCHQCKWLVSHLLENGVHTYGHVQFPNNLSCISDDSVNAFGS